MFAPRSRFFGLCALVSVLACTIAVHAMDPIEEPEVEKIVIVPQGSKAARWFRDPYNIEALENEEKAHAWLYQNKTALVLEEANLIEQDHQQLLTLIITFGVICGVALLFFLVSIFYWRSMLARQERVRYVEELDTMGHVTSSKQ